MSEEKKHKCYQPEKKTEQQASQFEQKTKKKLFKDNKSKEEKTEKPQAFIFKPRPGFLPHYSQNLLSFNQEQQILTQNELMQLEASDTRSQQNSLSHSRIQSQNETRKNSNSSIHLYEQPLEEPQDSV